MAEETQGDGATGGDENVTALGSATVASEGTPEEKAAAETKAAEEKAAAETKTAEEKAAAETKTAEEAKAAEAKAAEDKKGEEGAPEKYENFTVPEGTNVDPGTLTEFQELAKGLDLSQGDAQKVIDLQVKVNERVTEKHVQDWKDTKAGWVKDAKADKEVGGPKYDASVEQGKRAIEQFGTPALTDLLNLYGIGDHAEVIRFTSRVGIAIGEDSIHSGGDSKLTGDKTLAQKMYPNS